MARHKDPKPSPKAEALKAIKYVADMLTDSSALDALARRLMRATLDHAAEQIERIAELKRARRVKGEAAKP